MSSLATFASPFSGLFVRFFFRDGDERLRKFRESLERRIGAVLAGFRHISRLRLWRAVWKARVYREPAEQSH
jgi:hypothetical protein